MITDNYGSNVVVQCTTKTFSFNCSFSKCSNLNLSFLFEVLVCIWASTVLQKCIFIQIPETVFIQYKLSKNRQNSNAYAVDSSNLYKFPSLDTQFLEINTNTIHALSTVQYYTTRVSMTTYFYIIPMRMKDCWSTERTSKAVLVSWWKFILSYKNVNYLQVFCPLVSFGMQC